MATRDETTRVGGRPKLSCHQLEAEFDSKLEVACETPSLRLVLLPIGVSLVPTRGHITPTQGFAS